MGRVLTSLLAFVLLAVCSGLLAAAMFLPGATAMKSAVDTGNDVFGKLPVALQEKPLAKISTFLYADGSVMAKFYEQNRVEVPVSAISPHMINAQIAIEDERFYDHHGIDVQGIVRAAVKNAGSDGDIQAGGSTITQQYVKNMLIQNAVAANDPAGVRKATEGTLARKIREARLAMAVEKKYTKPQIIGKYLNVTQFGASQYGVEAAARHYFSKPAKKLTIAEAATLAGMVQSPNLYDPTINPDKCEKRRNLVLASMYKLGMITQDQLAQAKKINVKKSLKITKTPVGCETAGINAYFCDYAERVIMNDPTFGKTKEDRKNLLYRGGITFTTTLEKDTNQQAWDALNRKIPMKDQSGFRNALAAVEPGTGKIRAMAQDTEYKLGSKTTYYQTAINYNASYNYGGSNGFQPGSSFKPFALAEWIRTGHGLSQSVPAKSVQPAGYWANHCEPDNQWFPEWRVKGANGAMQVIKATTSSSNTGYAAIERQLDLCNIRDLAANLGVVRADNRPWFTTPAQVLGGNEVSPLSMAGAFAGFSARGLFCKPIAFTAAVDSNGRAIKIPDANCKQVLDESVADGVNYALQQVVTSGTAAGLGIGRPAAGKTGTTDHNVHTWFVGYTPQLAAAVWTGNPKVNKWMQGVVINGQYISEAYGASMSGPVWRDFMGAAMSDVPVQGFQTPPGQIMYGPKAMTPDVTGMDPQAALKALEDKGFPASIDKEMAFSDDVPQGKVASQNPEGGTESYAGTPVTLIISKGPEPEKDKGKDREDRPGRGNNDD